MKTKRLTIRYIIFDVLSAMLAWALLFVFRKLGFQNGSLNNLSIILSDPKFWLGIILVPLGWLALYTIQGTYKNVLRKSRLKELQQTAVATVIGGVVIFFTLLIDDEVGSYSNLYLTFFFLLAAHFCLTYLCRLIQTTNTVSKVHNRQIGFPTLLIGSHSKAYQTYLDLENQETYSGNIFVGYLSVDSKQATDAETRLTAVMPCLGTSKELKKLIEQHHIEEVIIAVEGNEQQQIQQILSTLDGCGEVIIKITPDARDIILGMVRIDSIFHSPLITINTRLMEEWQYSVKRICDIIFALLALILLSPVFLITAIIVKTTSPGPIFYAQERIGYKGKPFKMHKFRSMYIDAEACGPALSRDDDPRITPFGRFMRKVRLDEIPQFYNVLKGTMSIVGYRPERQFYIDQIVKRCPEYLLLQRIKPGITSWGQVKYGYASSVDEMCERLRYDLLYLENMSITTDIKILIYTVGIIFQGRGK